MDFSRFMNGIVFFAQNHTIIVIIIVLGLLYFMYRKPKLFFSIFFIGLVLAGLFYIITVLAGSSSEKKNKLTHEKQVQFDTER